MEKPVGNYLRTGIFEVGPLHPSQQGYRMARFTETALYELIESIWDTLENKETAVCLHRNSLSL